MKSRTQEHDIYTHATNEILAKARFFSRRSPHALADLLLLKNGVFIEHPEYAKDFVSTAHKIIGAQKYIYDDNTFAAVERTSSLETEEILGNLDKISFPFDRLWIIGRSPDNDRLLSCFLVETDSDTHSFKFRNFYYFDENDGYFNDKGEVVQYDLQGREKKDGIAALGKSLVTVDSQGIHFDEDALMHGFERNGEIFKLSPDKIPLDALPQLEDFMLSEIDSIHQNADFLARLFVVMGASSNPVPLTDKKLLDEEVRSNRSRLRDKFPVKLITGFMKIDLSLPGYENKTPTAKQMRTLLGWTNVRRSKPITSKYGKVFTRKPHDRRIPSPVDLRGRDRVVTVGNPESSLSTSPDRPIFAPPHPSIPTRENN